MRSWLGPSAAILLLSGCTGLFGAATLPEKPALDPDLVQRGAALFLDPRLSGDGSRSCASCHPGGGADALVYRDGESVAPGAAWADAANNATPAAPIRPANAISQIVIDFSFIGIVTHRKSRVHPVRHAVRERLPVRLLARSNR